MWRHVRSCGEPPELASSRLGDDRSAQPHLHARLSRTVDGQALLSATWDDLVLRKSVHRGGCFHAQIDLGRDRLALSGYAGRLTVTYGTRSIAVPAADTPDVRRRVRELLLAAPVADRFRRLAGELEGVSTWSPEFCGVRVTGALVAELDGDESAVRRLGRAVLMRHARPVAVPFVLPAPGVKHSELFAEHVLQASLVLEQRVAQLSPWSPARFEAALEWALHVEQATFTLMVGAQPSPRVAVSGEAPC